jgi:hypothetical protein
MGHSNLENFFRRGGDSVFIKGMSIRYPGYSFAFDRCAFSSTTSRSMRKGEDHFDRLIERINKYKATKIIGGIILMYGFIEGKDSSEAVNFEKETNRLLLDIRTACDNPKLPCLIGRYEKNWLFQPNTESYRKYASIVDSQINNFYFYNSLVIQIPIRYIAKENFYEGPHYNENGQRIFAEDAVALIQFYDLDFWYKGK